MPFKLSITSLNLMKDCPRCFWLERHNIKKRPMSGFPTLPNGMDFVLKKHFDKFMKRGELPPEIKDHHHTQGLKLFDDEELLKVWRNNLRGISYQDKDGNILCGAVDNILARGKKLIVLDYKTKGFPIKNEKESGDGYQDQLDVYNFLLGKNGFDTEDYAFLLFYIPKEVLETGEVVFDTLLARRNVDAKNAEELWKRALKLLYGECPNECCQWCERF
jgi:hypothetical protein